MISFSSPKVMRHFEIIYEYNIKMSTEFELFNGQTVKRQKRVVNNKIAESFKYNIEMNKTSLKVY